MFSSHVLVSFAYRPGVARRPLSADNRLPTGQMINRRRWRAL